MGVQTGARKKGERPAHIQRYIHSDCCATPAIDDITNNHLLFCFVSCIIYVKDICEGYMCVTEFRLG